MPFMNEIWDQIKSAFVRLFPFIIAFTGSLYNPGDSDLGWHLKYGQYFFQHHQVLKENIYSTMMEGYKWVNSSWATDLVTYQTFRHFGFYGLSVLAALVIAFTFYFFSKAAKLTFWEQAFIIPLVQNMEEPLFQVSFRGHLLSLLFLGILTYLLAEFNRGEVRKIFFAIPIFIFWSNLHGEFILGLGVFASFIFFYTLKLYLNGKKLPELIKNIRLPLMAGTGAFLAAIINPFTTGVYTETIRHFGNPLQKYVVEWLPLDTFSDAWWKLAGWGLVIFISLIILKQKKQILENLPLIGVTLVLYALSFWMRRYVWAMYLFSVPAVAIFFRSIKPKSAKYAYVLSSLILIFLYFYNTLAVIPKRGVGGMNWERFCTWYSFCSPKSAQFIIDNKLTDNLLTFYNWGGWLIWNYPQIKPSIDGRMHLWRDEKGYSAFADYYAYEQDWKNINESNYRVVYINLAKPLYKQMVRHVEDKSWKLVYKDDFAAVFTKT